MSVATEGRVLTLLYSLPGAMLRHGGFSSELFAVGLTAVLRYIT